MSTITRLTTTGSAGFTTMDETSSWNVNSKRIDMFKIKDLYPMFLRVGSHVRGFILPGFDPSLDDSDPSRASSFCSYRDMNLIDPKTGCPAFTGWVTFVKGYSYFGKSMSTFISPVTIGMPDPIVELRKYVFMDRRNNNNVSRWDYLVKNGPRKEDKMALPSEATMALLNVWSANTNEKAKDSAKVTNRVAVLKTTAWSHLASVLNEYRPASLANGPVDPEWSTFLRGDVTHPGRAVEWGIGTHKSDNGFEAAVFDFGGISMMPGGAMTYNARTAALPAEALAGRYDLTDIQNVLHIPTAQEIVELLVDEGLVPYELILGVCGHLVDHMPEKKASTVHTPQQPAPAQTQWAAQQPLPAAAAAAATQPQQQTWGAPAQQPTAPTNQWQQPVQTSAPAAWQAMAQQPVTQQPVMQQPATPAPQQPTWGAPVQQPTPWSQAPQNPLLQDDPEDDIPMGDPAPAAPVAQAAAAAPVAQAAAATVSSALSPAEEDELQKLLAALHGPSATLTAQDFERLKELRTKKAQG